MRELESEYTSEQFVAGLSRMIACDGTVRSWRLLDCVFIIRLWLLFWFSI